MQTTDLEDKTYYRIGNAIYGRIDYDFLMGKLGYTPEKTNIYRGQVKVSVEPFFVDLLRKGYKQWATKIRRDRTIVANNELETLVLYYNSTSPWAWFFADKDHMMVISLCNSEEKAIAYANKKLTEQYLNTKWLEMANEYPKEGWLK